MSAPKGNLTVGSPAKKLLIFALPFLLNTAASQLYSLSDAAVVGRFLGTESLAAIGSVGIIGWPFSFLGGLAAGFSALIAQQIGSGNGKAVRHTFYNALAWTAGISAFFSTLLLLFLRPLLTAYRVPEEILDLACRYGKWIVLVDFIGNIQYWLFHTLNASGNSKVPLFLHLVAGALNVLLDFLFVGVFGWDASSAGASTAIVSVLSFVLTVWMMRRALPMLALPRGERPLSRSRLLDLLRRGFPLGLTNLLTQTGVIVLSFCNNGLGTECIAGSNLGVKVLNFVILPIVSLGNAAAIYAAQNYGAGEHKRIRKGLGFCHIALFSWVAVGGAGLLLIGRPLLALMLSGEDSAAVVEYAYLYLLINVPSCFVLVPVTVQKFALQALSRRLSPMLSGVTEIICKVAVSVCLTLLVGYLGICLTNPISWFGAGIPIFIDYIIVMRQFHRLEKDSDVETVST